MNPFFLVTKILSFTKELELHHLFFHFNSRIVMCFHFPPPPETLKKRQIFWRNTYKIHHYKKQNGNPTINTVVILLSSRQLLQRKGWFIRINMRAQSHSIAKTYIVYWKEVDLLAFMMLQSNPLVAFLLLLGPQWQNVGSSSWKKGLAEPRYH